MTADDFRDMVLALDGAVERAHMGHPDFRVNGRIFASLTSDGLRGTVKLAPDEQRALVRESPGIFTPASGAWGRQGWTTIALEAADAGAVRAALLIAWQSGLQRPPARARRPARRR
jgi:hypothetical protein